MEFNNKRAVITGGASGIGEAVAGRIESEGGDVAVWDVNGGIKVDVSDYGSVENALARNADAYWRRRYSGQLRRNRRTNRAARRIPG